MRLKRALDLISTRSLFPDYALLRVPFMPAIIMHFKYDVADNTMIVEGPRWLFDLRCCWRVVEGGCGTADFWSMVFYKCIK